MTHWLVTWSIIIDDVDTPEQAAREAYAAVTEIGSTATVFTVSPAGDPETVHEIDLDTL